MFDTIDFETSRNFVWTLGLAASFWTAKRITASRIAGTKRVLTPHQRCRLLAIRGGLTAATVAGLALVWHQELQMLLLSLTTVIAAVVIAAKELILCVSGSVLRRAGASLRIGDWAEIAGTTGEVVDRTLLTTTLLEIDNGTFGYGYTGRTLVLPNAHMFSGATKLQRFGRDFVFHRFDVTFDAGGSHAPGVAEAVAWWEANAAAACLPFAAGAQVHRAAIESGIGAPICPAHPRIRLVTTELAKLQVQAELFCPTGEAAALERRLKTAFLDWLLAPAVPAASTPPTPDNANTKATANAPGVPISLAAWA